VLGFIAGGMDQVIVCKQKIFMAGLLLGFWSVGWVAGALA
jgi:hypothetical protein